MLTVLTALVISMIAGAVVLSSLEPDHSQKPILLHARGAVDEGLADAAYKSVVVRCDVARPGGVLSRARTAPAHLSIDTHGLLSASPPWPSSPPLDSEALIIRVDVQPSANALNDVQFETLEDLLDRLDRDLGLPRRTVRYESRHPLIPDLDHHIHDWRGYRTGHSRR